MPLWNSLQWPKHRPSFLKINYVQFWKILIHIWECLVLAHCTQIPPSFIPQKMNQPKSVLWNVWSLKAVWFQKTTFNMEVPIASKSAPKPSSVFFSWFSLVALGLALSLLAPDFCGGILVLNNFKFGENDSFFGGILQIITNHPINHPMLKINIQQPILTLMKTCIVKTMTWILSFRMIRRRFCSSLTVFHL